MRPAVVLVLELLLMIISGRHAEVEARVLAFRIRVLKEVIRNAMLQLVVVLLAQVEFDALRANRLGRHGRLAGHAAEGTCRACQRGLGERGWLRRRAAAVDA